MVWLMSDIAASTAPARGPAEHSVRDQIVEAAEAHFSRYGYGKTTVSDLAKAIGFSKAYIYKFFDSKQAIGEAIVSKTLNTLVAAVQEAVAGAPTPTEKIRSLFKALTTNAVSLFFNDRKLYDIAAHAAGEGWPPALAYKQRISQMLTEIIREGREAGEFERKTPLDETARAIHLVIRPFANPLLLQHNLDLVEDAPVHLSNLVLRSLAP
jgi:AcrR family transcriptional regulator